MRVEISNHYMTEQHQKAIMTLVRRLILKSSNDQYERRLSMEIDTLPHITTTMISSIDNELSAHLQETYKTIDMIAGGIQALNDDAQRLSNESLRLHIDTEEWKRDLTALQLSIEEENAFLNGIKPNQEILNQDVASLKQKVEDMQSISYDGTFIWRITSVKEKLSKFFNA